MGYALFICYFIYLFFFCILLFFGICSFYIDVFSSVIDIGIGLIMLRILSFLFVFIILFSL